MTMIDLTTSTEPLRTLDDAAWLAEVTRWLDHPGHELDEVAADFTYHGGADLYMAIVEDLVCKAFDRYGGDSRLFQLPEGCSVYFDIVADASYAVDGARVILATGWRHEPTAEPMSLSSAYLSYSDTINDRDATGVAGIVSVLRAIGYHVGSMLDIYFAAAGGGHLPEPEPVADVPPDEELPDGMVEVAVNYSYRVYQEGTVRVPSGEVDDLDEESLGPLLATGGWSEDEEFQVDHWEVVE